MPCLSIQQPSSFVQPGRREWSFLRPPKQSGAGTTQWNSAQGSLLPCFSLFLKGLHIYFSFSGASPLTQINVILGISCLLNGEGFWSFQSSSLPEQRPSIPRPLKPHPNTPNPLCPCGRGVGGEPQPLGIRILGETLETGQASFRLSLGIWSLLFW